MMLRRGRQRRVPVLPSPERLEARRLLATFTVQNVNDNGPGSFRQAINDANGAPGADTIAFDIAGTGVRTITPASPLPDVTEAVTIDGLTQAGSRANSRSIGSDAVLLVATPLPTLSGGGSIVRGLVITGGGVVLAGGGGHTIAGNYIGTDASGTVAPGLASGSPNQVGVTVQSSNNTIGGLTPALRNLISGNNVAGVMVVGAASNNAIVGNSIGTDASGLATLGNGTGVSIAGGAGNSIGAAIAGAGNLISGNAGSGIQIAPQGTGSSVDGTVVAHNLIGLRADGLGPLGNGTGLAVQGASGTTIGGTDPGAGNAISGNPGGGIGIFSSTGTVVQGNLVGLAVDGATGVGNSDVGIAVSGGSGTLIGGGGTPGARNYISGNGGPGIFLNAPGTAAIQNNAIGLQVDSIAPLGNLGAGVRVDSAAGLRIGGGGVSEGNLIGFNAGGGAVVASGTGVAILGNRIFSNGGLGIDLGSDAVTDNDPNDADAGANNLQNYPLLGPITSDGTSTTFTGTLNSAPSTDYILQFFASAFSDPTGHGEGQVFLGQTTVTTDGAGLASFSSAFPLRLGPAQVVTATATDPDGNTSEFAIGRPFTSDTQAELLTTVTASVNSAAAGQQFTYTITTTNNGPAAATNVLQVAGLPANLQILDAVPSQGNSSVTTPGAVETSFGSIASGSTASTVITVRGIAGGTASVTGLSYGGEADPNPDNNLSFTNVAINDAPDLAVLAAAAPGSATVGQSVTYTFTVTNGSGSASATNVVVTTSDLPAGLAFVSASTSQGNARQNGSGVLGDFGTIAPGGSATLTVVARPTAPGSYPLSAIARLLETDPNTANNTATASVNAVGQPDLIATFVAAPDPVNVGQAVTYTLTLRNVGTADATGATATLTASPNLAIGSASTSQGTSTIFNNAVLAEFGTIPAGGSATVTVVGVPTGAGAAIVYANTTSDEGDANGGDNSAAIGVTAIDATPTGVIYAQPILNQGFVVGYVLVFNGPLNPSTAENPLSYTITAPGRDGVFGSADDVRVPVAQAVYNPSSNFVVVFPRTRLLQNHFAQLSVAGDGPNAVLTDSGRAIDGDGNGAAGGTYQSILGRGRRLSYVDATGDVVTLQLFGFGSMTLIRAPSGEARALGILDGIPGRTSLFGSVRRTRRVGDGLTRIPAIVGAESINNRLRTPPFLFGPDPGFLVSTSRSPAGPAGAFAGARRLF